MPCTRTVVGTKGAQRAAEKDKQFLPYFKNIVNLFPLDRSACFTKPEKAAKVKSSLWTSREKKTTTTKRTTNP